MKYDVNIPQHWSSPLPIKLFPAHRALQGIHLGNRGLRGSMDLDSTMASMAQWHKSIPTCWLNMVRPSGEHGSQ